MANRLKFDADTHTYLLGGTPLISVTQLLHKHGLAPDYGGVDEAVLERKAARGTLIHREIEAWIKTGEDGFTTELSGFQALAKQYAFTYMRSETRVHNDIIAGTADLMCGAKMPDGRKIRLLADIKTTARIHTEYARWQLSVYEYLSGRTFDELAVIHLGEQARLITVPRVKREEVEKLIECERNGRIYTPPLAELSTALLEAALQAERAIRSAETVRKIAEERARLVRAQLLQEMERHGVTGFENDSMKITYVAPTTRTSIDTAKLRADNPDLCAEYTKATPVAASVRITLR